MNTLVVLDFADGGGTRAEVAISGIDRTRKVVDLSDSTSYLVIDGECVCWNDAEVDGV